MWRSSSLTSLPVSSRKLPVGFSCPCDRNAFSQYLTSLPDKEKDSIMKEGPFPLHLHCFNCGTQYQFEYDELDDLLRQGN